MGYKAVLGSLCFCLLMVAKASAQKIETGFLNRTITINKSAYRYQIYLPFNYTPKTKKKWPVILFLHGSGERGEDGLLQTDVGIATAVRRKVERFPAIIVMPQCNSKGHWTQGEMAQLALKSLDSVLKEFPCDDKRVYLTGISMGGAGSWYIAAQNPGRFAAVVPICGWVIPPEPLDSLPEIPAEVQSIIKSKDAHATIAELIGTTPVWIFHGEADKVVPVTESRKMAEAFKALNAAVKYTEYEDGGHNVWDQAYAEADFIQWLFAQRLGEITTETLRNPKIK